MLYAVVWIAYLAVCAAMLITVWRLWRGPSLADRVMALDKLYINAIALLILVGIHTSSDVYLEAAMLIALLGFVTTVAACKYVTRGDIIE